MDIDLGRDRDRSRRRRHQVHLVLARTCNGSLRTPTASRAVTVTTPSATLAQGQGQLATSPVHFPTDDHLASCIVQLDVTDYWKNGIVPAGSGLPVARGGDTVGIINAANPKDFTLAPQITIVTGGGRSRRGHPDGELRHLHRRGRHRRLRSASPSSTRRPPTTRRSCPSRWPGPRVAEPCRAARPAAATSFHEPGTSTTSGMLPLRATSRAAPSPSR